jgi:hypothetical protein
VSNVSEMTEDRPLDVRDVTSSGIPTVAELVPRYLERQACVCKLPGLLDDSEATRSCETFIQQALSTVGRQNSKYQLYGHPEDLEPLPAKSARQSGFHDLNGLPDRYSAFRRRKGEIQWAPVSDDLTSDSPPSSNSGDKHPISDKSRNETPEETASEDGLSRIVLSSDCASTNDATTASCTPRDQDRLKGAVTAVQPFDSGLEAGNIRFVRISKTFSPESIDAIGCETCICSKDMCVPYKAISYT